MNKKNLFLSAFFMAGLLSIGSSFAFTETIPEEVTNDLYYNDSVYLRNLEYPEDLSGTEESSTASINGFGTVVIGKQKTGGFPRVILFGGTEVTSKRYFSTDAIPEWWDGEMKAPEKMIRPAASAISFENDGAHRGSRINIIDAYQFGLSNEEFSFSQDAYVIFNLGIKDGVKVWIAREEDVSISNSSWTVEDEDYCIVKDGLCSVKMDDVANQMVLITKAYFDCPVERIENGNYGTLPECAVYCDPGYVIDYGMLSCVRPYNLDENETLFRAEFAQRYDLFKGAARQGYFRYRDTRGAQLESTDSNGLDGEDKRFVEKRNLNNSARKNGTDSSLTVTEKSLWEAIKDLEFNLWREANRASTKNKSESNENIIEGAIENQEKEESQSQTFSGGILPRTGPGAFVGLAIAGIALIGFAKRR